MEHFDDLTSPPVVGRTYLARCVFVPERIGASRRGLWWPVHGAAHTDAEIGTPGKHYHLAMPLLGVHQAESLAEHDPMGIDLAWGYAMPVFVAGTSTASGETVGNAFTAERVFPRRCRRPWPEYPAVAAQAITATLERLYPQALPSSMRCPHRGINLAAVPARDGVITCPGHGLSWCAATGLPVCSVDGRYRDR